MSRSPVRSSNSINYASISEGIPLVPVPESAGDVPIVTPPRRGGGWGAVCYAGILAIVAATALFALGANLFASRHSQVAIEAAVGIPFMTTNHPLRPTALWGTLTTPLPTGAWFLNLAMKDGDQPVVPLPYAVKAMSTGVGISYSAVRRRVALKVMQDVYDSDLLISSIEKPQAHYIARADNLSVTLTYDLTGGAHFQAYLVRGSPYVTFEFALATPVVGSNAGILYVGDETVGPKGVSVRGTQFKLVLGNWETWLVYFSDSVVAEVKPDGLRLATPFSGILRTALLPRGGGDPGGTAEATLNRHAHAYATGAQVAVAVSGDEMTLRFSWDKKGFGELLMLALPHHVDMMDNSSAQFVLPDSYQTMKGKMTGVIGSTWVMKDALSMVEWTAKTPLDLSDPEQADKIAAIRAALPYDIATERPNAADPYGFGKQAARMARLALIAEEIGEAALAAQAAQIVADALGPWLRDDNDDFLVYDRTWGGVVSYNGLINVQADFGLSWYNDHHYHFGYFLYACAVACKMQPGFYGAYREPLDFLVLDIANSDPANLKFPIARHKDFFDGHSWASGLFDQANGKSQESVSEALNAYYAVYLLGVATGNAERRDWGRALLAMEMRGARTYWHMPAGTPIYDTVYASNRMTGVVAALETVHLTWFGDKYEWVHGINIMPVTPLTEDLLPYEYMEEEWVVLQTVFQRPDDPPSPQWRGIVYCAQAVVQPDAAWDNLDGLNIYDSGNSRSNALYWIATRPQRAANATAYNSSAFAFDVEVEAQCAANSPCFAQGLVEDCCPTAAGDWLGCCPSYNKAGDAAAACSANEGCAALGLTEGLCCPSNAGYLGCCAGGAQQHAGHDPDTPKACKNNPGCEALLGDCCPAPGNVYLGCCGATSAPAPLGMDGGGGDGDDGNGTTVAAGPAVDGGGGAAGGGGSAASGGSSAACSAHPACSRLMGNCCPSDDGVSLGCCGA